MTEPTGSPSKARVNINLDEASREDLVLFVKQQNALVKKLEQNFSEARERLKESMKQKNDLEQNVQRLKSSNDEMSVQIRTVVMNSQKSMDQLREEHKAELANQQTMFEQQASSLAKRLVSKDEDSEKMEQDLREDIKKKIGDQYHQKLTKMRQQFEEKLQKMKEYYEGKAPSGTTTQLMEASQQLKASLEQSLLENSELQSQLKKKDEELEAFRERSARELAAVNREKLQLAGTVQSLQKTVAEHQAAPSVAESGEAPLLKQKLAELTARLAASSAAPAPAEGSEEKEQLLRRIEGLREAYNQELAAKSDLEGQLADARAVIDNLERARTAAGEPTGGLQAEQERDELRSTVEKLSAELEAQQKETAALQAQLTEKPAAEDQAEAKAMVEVEGLKELEQERDELKSRLSQLQAERDQGETKAIDHQEIENQIQRAVARAEAAEQERDQLQSRATQLTAEGEARRDATTAGNLEEAEKAKEAVLRAETTEAKLKETELERDSLQAQLSQLAAQQEATGTASQEAESKAGELLDRLEAAEQERDQLRTLVDQLTSDTALLQQQLAEKTTELEAGRTDVAGKAGELAGQTSRLAEISKEVESLHAELKEATSANAELQKLQGELKKENEAATSAAAAKLEAMAKALATQKKEADDARQDLTKSKQETEKAHQQLAGLKDTLASVRQEVENGKLTIAKLKQESTDKNSLEKRTSTVLEQTQLILNNSNQQVNELKGILEQRDKELASLRNSVQEAKEAKASENQQSESLRAQEAELRAQVARLEEKIRAGNEEMAKVLREMEDAQKEHQEYRNRALVALKQKDQELGKLSQFETALAEVQAQLGAETGRKAQWSRDLAEAVQANTALATELQELKAALAAARAATTAAESKTAALGEQLAAAGARAAGVEQELAEARKAEAEAGARAKTTAGELAAARTALAEAQVRADRATIVEPITPKPVVVTVAAPPAEPSSRPAVPEAVLRPSEPARESSPRGEEKSLLHYAHVQAMRDEELGRMRAQVLELQSNFREAEKLTELHFLQEKALKEQIRELERRINREDQSIEYIKNVVVQTLAAPDRTPFLPVLATTLALSPEEQAKISPKAGWFW